MPFHIANFEALIPLVMTNVTPRASTVVEGLHVLCTEMLHRLWLTCPPRSMTRTTLAACWTRKPGMATMRQASSSDEQRMKLLALDTRASWGLAFADVSKVDRSAQHGVPQTCAAPRPLEGSKPLDSSRGFFVNSPLLVY